MCQYLLPFRLRFLLWFLCVSTARGISQLFWSCRSTEPAVPILSQMSGRRVEMCCRGWRVVFEGRGLEIELYHDAIIQRNERRKLETCPAFKTLGCSELTVEDGRVVYQSLQHLMNWQQVDTVPPTRRKDWDILQPPIEQFLVKIDWVVSLQFSRLKRSILYFSWDLCKWEPSKCTGSY